jgi:hypothetical protein
VWLLIQLTPVQNWLTRQAAKKLSRELNTKVSVKHVDFSLFNKMLLEGVLVEDRNNDTLVFAGRTSVNITDWFFIKDKAELSYISLDNASIFLHRKDSVWNYQFLVDYFSSPSTGKKKKEIELSLKKIELSNIHVTQKDEWQGEDIEGKLRNLVLDADEFNLSAKKILINKLNVDQPFFVVRNYSGLKPKSPSKPDEFYHQSDTIQHWNTGGWQLAIKTMNIEKGELKSDKETDRLPYDYFDGLHVHFSNITGKFTNLKLSGDTLTSAVSLTAKERSGFTVNKMTADLLWYPQAMEFTNLFVETPNSRIGNAFTLNYTNFVHDMNQFITHVRMNGELVNCEIHSNDLAYFAPQLKELNRKITISGRVRGTVDHLKGKNIVAKTGNGTLFNGDVTMDGLPDIHNTFLDVKANDLRTNYNEVAGFYPGIRKITMPNIARLQAIQFKGSFTGYFKDFVAYGTAQTNLGTVVSDINFKIPEGKEAIYSGKVKTSGFQLGSFINEPHIGRIVFDGSLKGRGFTPKTLFAEVDGKIREIQVNNYNYTNIQTNGIVERRKFDGIFRIDDPNIALNMTGVVDFSKDTPVYRVAGTMFKSNFKNLNLSDNDLSFSGDFDVDFRLKKIEDFNGVANIKNAKLLSNGNPLSFDSLYVSNITTGRNEKTLILRSNEINATLKGNYNLVYLPDAVLLFLHNYIPAYIPAPTRRTANQDFSFDVETKNIGPFISLFNPLINGFENSTIRGKINSTGNVFQLNGNVPSFEYKNILFEGVDIQGNGNLSALTLNGSIDEVKFNDSLRLPHTDFTISAANDTGSLVLKTSATQTVKDANLRARFLTSRDGFTITFQPSTVMLNDKTWTIEDESNVLIGKNKVLSDGLKLTSGKEEIFISAQPSEQGHAGEDVIVELRKIQAGDIVPYFLKDPRLEGSVTGRIDIADPFGKMRVEADLKAEQFRFNNDSVGTVTITGNYNPETGDINSKIESDNVLNEFFGSGRINIKDPKNPEIDYETEIKNQKLSVLQKYLSVIMKDVKGVGNGTIRIKGKGSKPDLIGKIRVRDASFILDYTKCRYLIEDDTELTFREGELDFGSTRLRDTTGRRALFSGKLYHQFFRDMAFDMRFRTTDDKKGMVVLNTVKKDNPLFYGKVIARAAGRITGRANDITIRLEGEPTDSSVISLPTSDSRVTSTADFIVFRKYGKEMKPEFDVKESSNLTVDLDLTANPLAKIKLILDEVTNDIIEGQGNGVINLRVGTNEGATMSGTFEITRGVYTFNWEQLFKRQFQINRGKIVWGGDPYNADINIDAGYVVRDVTLPPEFAKGCSNNARSNLNLIANLSNKLKDPKINFSFELPQEHPCRNNPLTQNALNQLYQNKDELNKQVASLIIGKTFISSNAGTGTNIGIGVATSVAGTISEFLAQQITYGLGAILKSIPGLNKLNLDPYVTFNPTLISGLQAEGLGFQGVLNSGFTTRFLNGKLLLKTGGSLVVNNSIASTASSGTLTPDISLEWLLTQDGKLRLIGFYRTLFDIQRRNNKTGLSFSYVYEWGQ